MARDFSPPERSGGRAPASREGGTEEGRRLRLFPSSLQRPRSGDLPLRFLGWDRHVGQRLSITRNVTNRSFWALSNRVPAGKTRFVISILKTHGVGISIPTGSAVPLPTLGSALEPADRCAGWRSVQYHHESGPLRLYRLDPAGWGLSPAR
jgi:hypothetical protein